MNKYYVYMYLDSDNIPFYIGKGKGDRYLVSQHFTKNVPNRLLKNKILKVGKENIKVQFLHKDLTEEEAFYWEEFYIATIGRRDKKEGTLCNLTDGGEGFSLSKETRKKISSALKGKPAWNKGKSGYWKGKTFSEEHKRKLSDGSRGEKNHIYGKHWSEKTRRKMSEAHKGKKNPMHKKSHTKEAQQKMREAWKCRKVRGEGNDCSMPV